MDIKISRMKIKKEIEKMYLQILQGTCLSTNETSGPLETKKYSFSILKEKIYLPIT